MNKYFGLLELKHMGIPCIEWQEYTNDILLDSNCKWTVRVANRYGKDTSLPHKIGISASDAYITARTWKNKYDLVIISEFFKAKISGNLLISYNSVAIEWVYGNSTDLTRKGFLEENIQITFCEDIQNKNTLLDKSVFLKLMQYAVYIKNKYMENLLDGKAAILEWSIIECDRNVAKCNYIEGELIFYDFRIV